MYREALVPGEEREVWFIRLMDTYGGLLMGLCIMLLKDHHLAEDAVQETFLRAWRTGGLRVETERAWLVRVAANICRDHQRSRWFRFVERRVTPEDLTISVQPEENDVIREVKRLPLKEREVIVMHYWGGMTAAEVAETLGIARASVYRRMDNAKKKLKIELDEKGDAAHD